MTKKFVDCFMLMSTALSIRGGNKLPEMGRPLLQDFSTTRVNLSLSLQEIKVVDSNSLEIEVAALLNQKWRDPRLGANIKTRKMAVAGQIWKPKIVNLNGENTICNNEDTVFWRGFGDQGNILLSEKVIIKTSCTSDYWRFPFDVQMCQVKFGSYRFPQDEVALEWDTVPLHITADLNLNEYDISTIKNYMEVEVRCSGNFSTAVVQFTFIRHWQHYFQCIMLPSFILSVLNYATFWFSLNKRSTRLYTNLFVFGLMVNFCYISACFLYKTQYLKAMDVFVLVNTIFSVITLLETLLIDSMCGLEEFRFHLKTVASSKEYPPIVFWVECVTKGSYPIFYLFSLFLWWGLYKIKV